MVTPQKSDFKLNWSLFVLMVALYLLSLAAFTYINLRADPEISVWDSIFNGLILSIPLILFFGAIYVLISAWRQRKDSGKISPLYSRIIHWAPRIAAIMITFFIALFSLDVFEPGKPFLEVLGAFFMHNIPTFGMIGAVIWAWRKPKVGFILFLAAGIFFLRFIFAGQFDPANFILFSGPLLLVSALFYADDRWNKPLPPVNFASADS